MPKEKQEKKRPESFDKNETDLEDQKGNLTELVTNYKLSSYCRLLEQLVRQYFRLPGVHSKNTLQNIWLPNNMPESVENMLTRDSNK